MGVAGKVKVIVLAGNGINCEYETAHASKLGGADTIDTVHINELLGGGCVLEGYHLLCLPGGFLDGDDLGAAKACANRFRHATRAFSGERFWDELMRFIAEGKLIFGICNGFQLMAKLGLVPALGGRYGEQEVTLTFNDSGRFEDRWVHLKVNTESPCVFTKGLGKVYLPVRHGEGKFITAGPSIARQLTEKGLVCLHYTDERYREATMEYPLNPNGSVEGVAGICDETGRIFGLMPHPEAYLHRTHHPRWTREELPEEGGGVAFFRNAVGYIREHLL
ncbi:MAG: phosphoribosylformylglycinamidine synthase [Deltaproteobacteria bacterium RBG_13_52_11]|nr:MAG: phosphoribosylformylglycinamidine synthase [Deltaproteobacteria bacterium RBG_13_52_11]